MLQATANVLVPKRGRSANEDDGNFHAVIAGMTKS